MLESERRSRTRSLTLRGRTLTWGERTYIMGIVNATPDSFSGDGVAGDVEAATKRAKQMVADGADMIDVGGESTRPGHTPVAEEEEAARVLPVIAALRAALPVPISIDTFKPSVAARALQLGADVINCVWGAIPGITDVAAAADAPLVIMHNRATAEYAGDVVEEVISSLERAVRDAQAAGVTADKIIVDPGIGFGKTAEHNLEILRRLREVSVRLAFPLLLGTSRKSFIGKVTGLPVKERTFGTAASVALSIAGGADIVRVHDVAEMSAVARVADAICRG
ncbi:MAG: dihydropteroate synthase [Candidatus Eremiobacteraeota bacterium]|nr:dihydropteroate synthase [Candidatus Eremiobacteraeota bacterium]MBV8281929.1 dihydropteroate synthase [Candidatus Eremiobacteraeota bacterium]